MILNRQRTVPIARPALESFLRRLRRHLRLGNAELTIAFVTNAEIARMNATFRKKQGPTDVLSFPVAQALLPVPPSTPPTRNPRTSPQHNPVAQALLPVPPSKSRTQKPPATKRSSTNVAAAFRGGRVSPPTPQNDHPGQRSPFLGDIAISPTTARRNAKSSNRPLTHELRILMLHGVLHLLGYDHETDSGQMHRLEQKLRLKLGLA
jgi:rRNA maturation RNase YbeY